MGHLKELGLMPKIDEDGDIAFTYQMVHFAVIASDGDDYFLRMTIPNIYEVDENNRLDVLEACSRVSCMVKVAKVFIAPNDNVWVAAEQLLDKTPNYEDVIPRTIRILMGAMKAFGNEIEG